MTPIDKVFGDGSRCIDYGGGIAMHWFPKGKKGERCFCGETTNDRGAGKGKRVGKLFESRDKPQKGE